MVISFHELAERELNDAAQYYEQEQAGLGAAFIADVRRCTDAIVEHPEAGSVILHAQWLVGNSEERFALAKFYVSTWGGVKRNRDATLKRYIEQEPRSNRSLFVE